MRKLLTVILLSTLAAGVVAAASKGSYRPIDGPRQYQPSRLDGAIVQVQNDVDGRAWSAWAYRNGAEYDLALSVTTAPGVWSQPRLIGLDDGLSQGRPALAVDARGTVYLAFTNGDGSLLVRALRAHSGVWLRSLTVSAEPGRISSPTLKVVGDALVVAYRDGNSVGISTLPLLTPVPDSTMSIYDGPDPTGREEQDDSGSDKESDEDEDAFFNLDSGGIDVMPHGSDGEN